MQISRQREKRSKEKQQKDKNIHEEYLTLPALVLLPVSLRLFFDFLK
jgi:hypothetical protein